MNLSTIYTHGADFFLARIQALEAEGEARMLGRPSVLTVDNVQATLENTSTYYIQVEGYQAVDLFKVEAGTVLRVTPHIIRNERGQTSIKLAVSVQDDQNDSKDAPVSDNSVPPIKQTKINTQAIVGAGQSLLIRRVLLRAEVHGCQRHTDPHAHPRARKPLQDDEQGDQTHGAPDPHYAEGHPFG